jgi:hypothetical protein
MEQTSQAVRHTPCYWPADYSGCSDCGPLQEMPPEERAKFEQMAAEMLYAWSGRIFGVCDLAIRPCREDCGAAVDSTPTFWGRGPYPASSRSNWTPVLVDGKWLNVGCGCAGTCTCTAEGATALQLPGPVQAVTRVRVDGRDLLPTVNYRVAYNRILIRTDGEVWPACQDMLAEPDKPNTFEVLYRRGVPVPVGGQMATGVLACELAKAYCKDASCALPQRLQTITRQGVTIGFQDSFEDLKQGGTGIWTIDSWLASVTMSHGTATVRSVDISTNRGIGQVDRTRGRR